MSQDLRTAGQEKPSLFQQLQLKRATRSTPECPLLAGLSGAATRIIPKSNGTVPQCEADAVPEALPTPVASVPLRLNVVEVNLDEKKQVLCQPRVRQTVQAARPVANHNAFAPSSFLPETSAKNKAEETFYKDKDWDRKLTICEQCNLPMGDLVYHNKGCEGKPIHGECLAQQLLVDLKTEEKNRLAEEANVKEARRVEYDIGWKADQIPCNIGAASKLELKLAKETMCCLVLSEDDSSVRLQETLEPTAAVNLEYLSIALQVCRNDGREPLFSLDGMDKGNSKMHSMIKKRFEPEWLAGTSVGDVLFQADYHLKELSMGDCAQPVVGMKSAFDFSAEDGHGKAWNAREWFMVRKAEVHLSKEREIIPFVKMAVEAREQISDADGLRDAPITREDHPMVKYAESFTQNFDLIAERKSVIYHLRELAKATCLAKFLVDNEMDLGGVWYNLAGEARESECLEIPQLWNEQYRGSKIQLNDGALKKGSGPTMHGLYGGVNFGMNKFDLRLSRLYMFGALPPGMEPPQQQQPEVSREPVKPVRAKRRPQAPAAAAWAPAPRRVRSMGVYQSVGPPPEPIEAPPPPPRPVEPYVPPPPPMAIMVTQTKDIKFRPPVIPTKGVDLSLNQFDLSSTSQAEVESVAGNWAREGIGNSFWANIDEDKPVLDDDAADLLRDIFNPNLSDRREEGDNFVPPGAAFSYVEKLRSLLKVEAEIRNQRKEHFVGTKFVIGDAGPLFPASWTDSLETAHGRPEGAWLQKAESKAGVEQVLLTTTPIFEKTAEDGMKFRIYKSGSLEVRTIQEHGKEETIGAVFSIRTADTSGTGARQISEHEKIVKVTEYVEFAVQREQDDEYCYYVVMESDRDNLVVTEKLKDGSITWEENPAELEDRSSLAKVIRAVECRLEKTRVSFQDVKSFQAKEGATISEGRMYAQRVFIQAVGGVTQMIRSNNIKVKTLDDE